MNRLVRPENSGRAQSPPIWRCRACGALVHVADEEAPAASCARCGRIVSAIRDGGDG